MKLTLCFCILSITDKPKSSRVQTRTFKLTIDGEVENPVSLSWIDLMKLAKMVSTSIFPCIKGCSVVDFKWEGVHIREIEKLVKSKDVVKL